MAKSATSKSPSKPRPRPKPRRKNISSPYIDDEAHESDEGVMVDRPIASNPRTPDRAVKREPRDTDLEDDDDDSFINDGDPYAGASKDSDASETFSPQASGSASKLGEAAAPPDTPSPSKKGSKTQAQDEVIEVDSTSEEDLETMDVDDSNFRKPPGVKPSALPPGLKTRSVVKREASASQPPTANPRDAKRSKVTKDQDTDEEPAFMANMDEDTKREVAAWKERSGRSGQSVASRKRDLASSRKSDRESVSPPPRPSKTKKISTRPVSPDWDSPFGDDNLDALVDNEVQPEKPGSPTPPPRGSKGKAKATTTRASPDWEPPSPIEILEEVIAKKSPTKPSKKSVAPSKSTRTKTNSSAASGSKASGDLTGYVHKRSVPAASASGGNEKGKAPLTMAQYLRQSRGEPLLASDDDGDDADPASIPPTATDSTVFLEDLETYKASYNASAPCGVFDIALQDSALREHYLSLPPLPSRRRLLAAYDRSRSSGDDEIDFTTGGRVQFSSWFKQLPRMIASNSMGAMLFEEADPQYINLSRISPLRLSTRVSAGTSATHRLYVDARIAICLSAICVTESHVVAPRSISTRSDRRRKYISGVFHDQDWERFESIVSLVFGHKVMYAQMVDRSISFQTKISPEDADFDRPVNNGVPAGMFSTPSPSKSTSAPKNYRGKTLLEFDDPVPVYDARRIAIDFDADLDRLGRVLPLFSGEVPPGSFAVVGYSCSGYSKAITTGSVKVPHVGLNVLWVIVCGVPSA